jgi:transposase
MTIEVASQVKKRQKRSVEEKRRIVEETLVAGASVAGASVARVARRHAVNANQVFYWRKKYHEGQLGKGPSSKLLPVTLSDSRCGKSASWSSAVGSLEIKLSKGTVRVAGNVEVVMLRTAIESLLG